MNVSLTPALERLIARKLKSGLYRSASEVIREALRLLHERDRFRELRLEDARKEVSKGIRDLNAGRSRTFDAKLAESIKSRGRKLSKSRHSR